MTHDPREALEPCPFCGDAAELRQGIGGLVIQCKAISCNGTIGPFESADLAAAAWNTRALTASPGEQKPCGWQFLCADGKWIGCDEPPANELRDEPEKFRRVYLSPPPAAGWNEAINWLEGIARNDGNADQLAAQRCVAILRAGQDFRREAPAPEGVDRPDAGGSDPTAERREIVALGDLVTVNELAPYFGDWRGVTLKVVGLRLTPDGEEWASVIEGDQRHRGNGQYDGETDGFNVQWLSKCAALDGGAGA